MDNGKAWAPEPTEATCPIDGGPLFCELVGLTGDPRFQISQLRSTGNQFCPPSPFSILTSRNAREAGDQLHDPVSQSGWSHKIATTTRRVVFDRAAKSASPLPLWHSPHGWLIPIPYSRLPSAMKADLLQQMCEKIWLQTMKKHHVIPLYALENNPEASWISSPWWKSFELIRPQFQVQQWIT